MLIRKMIISYPNSDIELTLGDKEVKLSQLERDTTIRLKRLEEELSKSGDFLVEVIDINHSINVKNRYVKIEKKPYDDASGISLWGLGSNDGYYDWGSGKWGEHSDAFPTEETMFIKQNKNI